MCIMGMNSLRAIMVTWLNAFHVEQVVFEETQVYANEVYCGLSSPLIPRYIEKVHFCKCHKRIVHVVS